MNKLFYFWIFTIILFLFNLINFNISFRYSASDTFLSLIFLLFSLLIILITSIIFNKKNSKDNYTKYRNINLITSTPIISVLLTLIITPFSYFSFRDCSVLPIERQCGCIYIFATKSMKQDNNSPNEIGYHNQKLYNLKCQKGRFLNVN